MRWVGTWKIVSLASRQGVGFMNLVRTCWNSSRVEVDDDMYGNFAGWNASQGMAKQPFELCGVGVRTQDQGRGSPPLVKEVDYIVHMVWPQ